MVSRNIGSNNKPRTTLVFGRPEDKNAFGSITSDLGYFLHTTKAEATLTALINTIVKTKDARYAARVMYGRKKRPRCKDAFETVFSGLAALGEEGKDSLPLVECFKQYVHDLWIQIDTTGDNAVRIHSEWESVVEILEREAQAQSEDMLIVAAKRAKTLLLAFDNPSPQQEILSFVTLLIESWSVLRKHRCSFSLLCNFANLANPERDEWPETPSMRMDVLAVIDEFYASDASGEEVESIARS